jgi:peptidoglycan-N-acetylmuramic acid deacetylase
MKKIFAFLYVFVLVLLCIPNVSAKTYGWGFKRNDNHVTPDIGIYANEIKNTSSYYVGSISERVVYLTFDAGYDNGVLGKILDVLHEKNVKSTFFVTGDFVEREKELLLRIVYEDHIVGNHTWSHKYITKLSFEELDREVKKVETAYSELTMRQMFKLFRPPAGEFDRKSLLNVQKLGYTTVFWSLAYKDWETRNQKGSDFAYNNVMNNLHNGAIVLMHTVSEDNLQALPKIIDGIREQGYTIKNLDYLIRT